MHAANYDHFQGQIRMDRVLDLQQNIYSQTMLMKSFFTNESSTKLSYMISAELAKKGKPLSDGEIIKDCLKIFCDEACPEKSKIADEISLSHQTVSRRVEELGDNIAENLLNIIKSCHYFSIALDESTDICDISQLAIFVRVTSENFVITEELLDLCPMTGTTTGKDILNKVMKVLKDFDLPIGKLCSVTTDGASALTGKNVGFIKLFQNELQHEIISYHCIIHQQHLCAKQLNLDYVMSKVVKTVNFIRSKGLNHRQFKAFLEEVGSEFEDVIYFSNVRWLSRHATLQRFHNLIEEIKTFMTEKKQDTVFLESEEFLNDLAFFIDITKFLSELNFKLQGKEHFINVLYENIQSFVSKLTFLKNQMIERKVVHFKNLSTRNNLTNFEKYIELLNLLLVEFERRFQDFNSKRKYIKLFSDPFTIKPEDVPEDFQLEVLDLQSKSDLKNAHRESDNLIEFYKKYISPMDFPAIHNNALKYLSMFGSTYRCEQLFSHMKIVKNSNRNRLGNNNLTAIMRLSTSKIEPDINAIVKQKKQVHKSH